MAPSANLVSINFHFLSIFDLPVMRIAITPLHSLVFNCSVMPIKCFWRRCHKWDSVRGPRVPSKAL